MTGQSSLNRPTANAERSEQNQGSTDTSERPQRSKVSCAKSTSVHNAFISYSHAEDNELVPALQMALQRFAKPLLCRRALRIFLDKTHLPLTPALRSISRKPSPALNISCCSLRRVRRSRHG